MLTMNHNVLTEAATIDYEDGTYDIIAKALHEDKDEPSTAADYINEEAEVIIKNGELDLKITVPKNDQFSIYVLHKQGDEQTKVEDEDNLYYFFHLDEQNIEEAIINVVASYEVPDMDFTHEDVNFRFQLEELDDLTVNHKRIKKTKPKKTRKKMMNLKQKNQTVMKKILMKILKLIQMKMRKVQVINLK